MLTAETKRRLDACRNVLVGKLPLPTDQVELITLALIYKFMDDLDEESVKLGGKRSFFVGPLEKYRWRALLPQTVSADQRMTLFAEGIEAIGKAEHLPALFRDIFRNSFLKFRDGRILTLFLNEINGFVYSHSEELGNAFEYLLKTMGIQAENGQFRTPRHIINFMVACLDPQPNDRILDPACGTGGFLVSAYKHILAQYTSPGSKVPGDKLTHDQRQKVYSNLTGYDVTDLMVKLSKVNLFLHGFPDPAIQIYDTLSNEARWHEKADLIMANPPFMTPKGGVSPHTKFRVFARKSEVLFTDYIAEHLTSDGRGGVIVPNGIAANPQNAYAKLRKFLVEDSLVAVVSLPGGVFRPYSGVKTSILFLDKKLARQVDKILFLKITADGFDLGDQRRPIADNDLPKAECVMTAWLGGNADKIADNPIAWKTIKKNDLLEHRACLLHAEAFLGGPAADQTVEVARVADVVEVNPKKAEVRSLAQETPVSFVPMEDLNADTPLFIPSSQRPLRDVLTGYTYFRNDDVLLAKITPCFENGKGGIARNLLNGIGFGSTEFYVLRAGERILPEYLYYAVMRAEFRKEGTAKMSGSVGQQRVTRDFLENYEIALPPLEEQRRIVAEIEGYQKVIDGARQILAGHRPFLNINSKWPLVPIGNLFDIRYGVSVSIPDTKDDNGTLIISTAEMRVDGSLDLSNIRRIRWEKNYDKFLAKANTLLFNWRNAPKHVGKTVLFEGHSEKILFASFLLSLERKNGTVENKFVWLVLNQLRYQGYFVKHARQAVNQANFNAEELSRVEIPLPPLDEQRRIVAELDGETLQMESVRALIPRFETKIQRVLDRVWGNGETV